MTNEIDRKLVYSALHRSMWVAHGDIADHAIWQKWIRRKVAYYSPSHIADAVGTVVGLMNPQESAGKALVALESAVNLPFEYAFSLEWVPFGQLRLLPGGENGGG